MSELYCTGIQQSANILFSVCSVPHSNFTLLSLAVRIQCIWITYTYRNLVIVLLSYQVIGPEEKNHPGRNPCNQNAKCETDFWINAQAKCQMWNWFLNPRPAKCQMWNWFLNPCPRKMPNVKLIFESTPPQNTQCETDFWIHAPAKCQMWNWLLNPRPRKKCFLQMTVQV